MAIETTRRTVHFRSGEEPAAERLQGVEYAEGRLPDPTLINREIEADELRMQLAEGQGNVCFAFHPGEEYIGELRLNVQFEGPKGQADYCMSHHNEWLADAGRWLGEFLDQGLQGDFVAEVDADPCPKTTIPVRVDQVFAHGQSRQAETVQRPSQEVREQHRTDG